MKNKLRLLSATGLILLLMLLLWTSCAKRLLPYFPVFYNVINNTESKITISYKASFVYPLPDNQYDSIFTFEPGGKKTLIVNAINKYKGNPEDGDSLVYLYQIKIYNQDSIESNKDFKMTKYWIYTEGSTSADLDLIVNPDDF